MIATKPLSLVIRASSFTAFSLSFLEGMWCRAAMQTVTFCVFGGSGIFKRSPSLKLALFKRFASVKSGSLLSIPMYLIFFFELINL